MEINVTKWNRLLSLWESRGTGQPSTLIKSEEELDKLIEALQYFKQYTAFSEGSNLAIGVYENSPEWIQENSKRPRWNLSAKITTPKTQVYTPPDDEELPFTIDDKGKVKPNKEKMPWE